MLRRLPASVDLHKIAQKMSLLYTARGAKRWLPNPNRRAILTLKPEIFRLSCHPRYLWRWRWTPWNLETPGQSWQSQARLHPQPERSVPSRWACKGWWSCLEAAHGVPRPALRSRKRLEGLLWEKHHFALCSQSTLSQSLGVVTKPQYVSAFAHKWMWQVTFAINTRVQLTKKNSTESLS